MREIGQADTSPAALARTARELVASAMAGDYPADPLIDSELSGGLSTISSVVKRHGWLLQTTTAHALAASGRFVVWTDVPLPLTKAARALLDGKNSRTDLARIRLPADSEADRMVTFDLVVVDPVAAWAGVYEMKRGNGTTETRKRLPIEQSLQAGRLVLPSFLEKLGYKGIERVTSAVIDYYGNAGFSPDLTLTREQLDAHFSVPVVATVEAMTTALHDALEAELPRLFGPYLDRIGRKEATTIAVAAGSGTVGADLKNAAVMQILSARPVGPGLRPTDRPVPATSTAQVAAAPAF
ncbi:hypothetical protein RA307_02545 [Xanthobacteraceae bacterium Astr-EGSB]|uniref:hypothetical protein n=1 Tax=Astrobacterium formosum TaxID=3069710 RepID=UPI0027B4B454|nr:hypothetical protein [Xanthobacteraceae bacterium Astr-EGSB]